MGMDDKPAPRHQKQQPSDNDLFRAEDMLNRGESGTPFSDELNNMSVRDQRSVFAAMKHIQNNGKFQDVQLVDSDNDGLLDDARARGRNGNPSTDVYDTPNEARTKKAAQNLLSQMEMGANVTSQYDQLPPDQQRQVYAAMKDMIADNNRFSRISVSDRNNDGIMDDARAVVGQPGNERQEDVYDSPRDRQLKQARERVQEQLPEVIDGVRRGSGEKILREIEKGIGGIFRQR